MSRFAAYVAIFALVGAAALVGSFLGGPWRTFGLAVVGASGLVLVRQLVSPFRALERAARLVAAGDATTVVGFELPEEARNAAVALDAAIAAQRDRLTDVEARGRDLTLLLDRMDEGVVAIEKGGRLRVTNRAARQILGLSGEAGPRPMASEVRSGELRAVLDTSLQTQIHPREILVGGREILVESNPVEGGAIVRLRDVTDVRRLEQVRTDFVANASHELKTPLTAVRGFAETLLDDEEAPADIQRQFLRMIYENTIRLQNIVEDLLDLSRLESGGWSPELEAVDVGDVARDSWAAVQEVRGAVRTFTVRGRCWALADRGGLHHVLRNLLDNAVRHTDPDGHIGVVTREEGGSVVVEVTDDGAGIPPDQLPRIFERFFRVDKARSRAQGGTGLGLAIVSHLVSRMGGSLSAESQFGVGTSIRFTLPKAMAGTPTPVRER